MLRFCDYTADETVVDPLCGSGTLVIEAAEIAAGLLPGRSRDFAFENLATFDEAVWQRMRNGETTSAPAARFYGYDRDPGAVRMSQENAQRAGVDGLCDFQCRAVGELAPPDTSPGLVVANPPYGARIGNVKGLKALYGSFGQRLMADFTGWRVGLMTSDAALAKATGLTFTRTSPPVAHGGLKVRMYATDPLP